jgi:hypothetical protein
VAGAERTRGIADMGSLEKIETRGMTTNDGY